MEDVNDDDDEIKLEHDNNSDSTAPQSSGVCLSGDMSAADAMYLTEDRLNANLLMMLCN